MVMARPLGQSCDSAGPLCWPTGAALTADSSVAPCSSVAAAIPPQRIPNALAIPDSIIDHFMTETGVPGQAAAVIQGWQTAVRQGLRELPGLDQRQHGVPPRIGVQTSVVHGGGRGGWPEIHVKVCRCRLGSKRLRSWAAENVGVSVEDFRNHRDGDYLLWPADHHHGYMLNMQRICNPREARLHLAYGEKITGPGAGRYFHG